MFSDDEVIEILRGPLAEYHCVLKGAIVGWNPTTRRLSFVLQDDDEYYACKRYLTARGRNFNSIEELVAYGQSHRWPGWELIKTEYEEPGESGSPML